LTHWMRWFVYRKECLKVTWTFRLALAACVVGLMWLARGFWIPAIGRSLVCEGEVGRSDAVLVENFDPDYLLFERAEVLYRAGLTSRVLVATIRSGDQNESKVENGIAELMARIARLEKIETIPLTEIEPISLNAASQISEVLTEKNIRSITVLTSGFRSARSMLVYHAVLGRAGIAASCVPVFGKTTPESWANTWHGIQEVTEQALKLQYYRFYVLPTYAWRRKLPRQATPIAISVPSDSLHRSLSATGRDARRRTSG
jgi:hypothetical protein